METGVGGQEGFAGLQFGFLVLLQVDLNGYPSVNWLSLVRVCPTGIDVVVFSVSPLFITHLCRRSFLFCVSVGLSQSLI